MTAQLDTRNANFAAQKINQLTAPADRLGKLMSDVEAGKMTIKSETADRITFEVTEGWDRNEYLYFDKKTLNVQALHGLDENENGDVSLYLNGTNGPAWHGLGTVIPGGLSDAESVLRAARLDWNVEKRPMMYGHREIDPITGEERSILREVPNSFVTVRTDTGAALGTVGKIYTPVQNLLAYEMLTDLIGLGMVCESAGSMGGGSRVFVTAEIPEPIVIDPNGIADPIRQFLAIMNSHDGKTPLMAIVTPWRVLCGNTHRFAINGSSRKNGTKFTIRHTKNAKNKIEEARRVLGLTVAYYEDFAAEETELALSEGFTHTDLDELLREVWEVKEDSKRAVTLSKNRTEKIHDLFDAEASRIGRTAFAAENAVTAYVDHFAELRPRGDLRGNRLAALGQAILSETFDEPKRTAHEKLMLKVRGA